MLTPWEIALSAANEALSMGRGRVLGGDPAEVADSRLACARQAQHAVRVAIGTPRVLLREADDSALLEALARVARMADDLTRDVARYGEG